jgi:hypothetical protein
VPFSPFLFLRSSLRVVSSLLLLLKSISAHSSLVAFQPRTKTRTWCCPRLSSSHETASGRPRIRKKHAPPMRRCSTAGYRFGLPSIAHSSCKEAGLLIATATRRQDRDQPSHEESEGKLDRQCPLFLPVTTMNRSWDCSHETVGFLARAI